MISVRMKSPGWGGFFMVMVIFLPQYYDHAGFCGAAENPHLKSEMWATCQLFLGIEYLNKYGSF